MPAGKALGPAPQLALITVNVIWSLHYTVVKASLDAFEPLAFTLVRFAVGAAVMVSYVRLRLPHSRPKREGISRLVAAGIFGVTINQFGFVSALSATSAANTVLIFGTVPFFATALAVAARQEVATGRHILGIGGGLIGLILVVMGGVASDGGNTSVFGDAMALLAAFGWAAYTVLIRPLMRVYSAIELSAFTMAIGLIGLLPLSIPALLSQDWQQIDAGPLAGLAYSALLALVLTNLLYYRAVEAVGAARASLFSYLQPTLGVMFAVVLLGEPFGPLQVLGGAIVIFAIAATRPDQGAVSGSRL